MEAGGCEAKRPNAALRAHAALHRVAGASALSKEFSCKGFAEALLGGARAGELLSTAEN